MLAHEIDTFFDSISDKVLNDKWEKYNHYSNRETTTVSELLDHWSIYYENTFLIESCESLKVSEKIKVKKPERNFGFFYKLAL